MEFTKHYTAKSNLLKLINQQYAIKGERIRLYRAMMGMVFFIQTPAGRKVFKLYRPAARDRAIQTTHIIPYLNSCGYPVVQIIPSISGTLYITVEQPEGICVGVLFNYADGICIWALEKGDGWVMNPLTREFGKSVGRMHRLMDQYDKPLIRRGTEYYFDYMVWLLRRDNYNESKIRDFEEYGNELKSILEKLPTGFCHGDPHAGNTKYRSGQFTWMDFDNASMSYPMLDIGWMIETSYVVFKIESFDRSRRMFEEVYAGYTTERTLTDDEVAAAFHCVAIMHFDGTVQNALMGHERYTQQILDREHDWLMRWRDYCEKMK
jgi:Ser/Thr protein kinase RdoA (MazF antagonist)